MTQPGRAAIEIVGDASKLGPQLERDAQRAIDRVDIDTTNISKQIGDGFRRGADDASDAITELGDDVENTFRRIRSDSENMTRALSLDAEEIAARIGVAVETAQRWIEGLQRPIAVNRRALISLGSTIDDVGDGFDRLGRNARGAGQDVQSNLLRPLTSGFSRLGDVISSAGSALVGFALTGTNPAGLLTLALTAAALVTALPVIIGLVAALADLTGIVAILPGVIGALSASLIVGIVAFNGFGDAISAVLDGDPEKLAEAMERLAPSARVIVREFQRILPILRDVGREIQEGFFVQLNTILERFGTGTLPRVRDELRRLSGALGNALAGMASLLVESKNVGILERLFESTERSVEMLGEAFYALGQAFFNAIDAGLPSLEALSSSLAGAIESFATFINASIESGAFQAFLDDAIATFGELFDLIGAVGELLGVLFSGTDDAGRGFIGTLTDITQRLTEFFRSAEGQDTLQDFSEIIEATGIILGWMANLLREAIDVFNDIDDAVNATIDFFNDLGDAIGDAIDWFGQLGSDIADTWDGITSATSSGASAVGQFFTDLGSDIADTWDNAVQAVSDAVDSIIAFVSAIPDQIVAFVESIPGRIVEAFDTLVDSLISVLAVATATVIVFFTDLPRQIVGALLTLHGLVEQALRTLMLIVGGAMLALHNVVVQTFRDVMLAVGRAVLAVIAFVDSLPDRLAAGWGVLVQQVTDIFNQINDFIISTWEDIVTFFSELPGRIGDFFQMLNDAVTARVTALIEFVKGIPERVLSALGDFGRMLFNAGANIIQGLIDGISSKIRQLREKISSAVQEIRDHLPFSPARTGPLSGSGSPRIAGAVIAEMIAAGLDAGTPLISRAAGRAASAASPFGAIGQAGVSPLTSPLSGQGGTVLSPVSDRTDEQLVVIVNIDGQELTAIIDRRVDTAVSTEVRRLMAGTRGI